MSASGWTRRLADAWRADADARRRLWPADPVAAVLVALAAEMEAAEDAHATEALTISEAAAESGYSEAHLRELVQEGCLERVGRDGVIRVRRGALPIKPRQTARPQSRVGRDLGAALTGRRR